MPRISRGLAGGEIYHIINRGNRRSEIFHCMEDYEKFIELMYKAKKIANIKIYTFAIMPNHFHFILEPKDAEDVSKYMQWLLTSYVRYYNKTYAISGHLWQGRYKSFIVQKEIYLFNLVNYVLQNPKRAKLKNWKFISKNYKIDGFIDDLPIDMPEDMKILSQSEKAIIEKSIERQSPYGEENWKNNICKKYNLESTIKPRGRPRKIGKVLE